MSPMRLPRNDMGVVISADDPKWIEPFSGLTEVQFARLVALVRRRGGDVQRGRPWRLPLAARVLLAATYWRTNLTLRQVAPLLLQRHHALLCRLHLERIDHLTGAIGELSARIEEEILLSAASLSCCRPSPASARASLKSSSRRPAVTWPASRPQATSPRGPESALATTNPPASTNPADDATT